MAKLTYEERKALPSSAFCIPERRGYPVKDAGHAANALTRAKTFASKTEAQRVYGCACRRFPEVPACNLGFKAFWRKRRGR